MLKMMVGVFLSGFLTVAMGQMVTIPSTLAVNPSGGASYTIPIQVPPGVSGMEPQLALTYSSQGGNGPLGVGWGLSGLSAITRCPQTIAQDGNSGSVKLDENDRYCLDGQRLVLASGTYGGHNAEYRTELESFARIISYGVAGKGPASFRVWTKSGLVMDYGTTADSAIEAQGKSTILTWALSRATDVKGNYYSVNYTEDSANGSYYPAGIGYTGNANTGLAPIASVAFGYELRGDAVGGYLAGSLLKQTQRLTKIKLTVNGALAREYRVHYVDSAATGRSLVDWVWQCDANSQCLPAFKFSFTWNQPTSTFTPFQVTSLCANNSMAYGGCNDDNNYSYIHSADINGDGRSDLCFRADSGIKCFLATANGWDMDNMIATDICADNSGAYGICNDSNNYKTISFADVNGDGMADLVYRGDQGMQVWFSNGSGFVNRQSFPVCADWSTAYGVCNDDDNTDYIRLADINGDGRADLCFRSDNGIRCMLSTGQGWDTNYLITTDGICGNNSNAYGVCNDRNNYKTIAFVDVDGDGKADLVYRGDQGMWVWFSTGTAFVNPQSYDICADGSSAYGICNDDDNTDYIRYADLNGDGKTDLCFRSDSGITCFLFDGNRWDVSRPIRTDICANGSANYGSCNDANNYTTINFFDVNGDGQADLVFRGDKGLQIIYFKGGGFVTTPISYPNICADFSTNNGVCNDEDNFNSITFADVNGDGKAELIYRGDQGIQVWASSGANPDTINASSNGFDVVSWLNYKPLTDAGVYIKGKSGTYPVVDLQMPMHVISSVVSSNGLGGTLTTNYRYGGLKAEIGTGRGLLGFEWMETTQVENGMVSRTNYRQDFPYTGMPQQAQVSKAGVGNNGLLKESLSSYICLDPARGAGALCAFGPGQRYFIVSDKSAERSWDENGTQFPINYTLTTYDCSLLSPCYGNAVTVKTVNSEGYSKTTTSTYDNDSVNWRLGRLKRSVVVANSQDSVPLVSFGSFGGSGGSVSGGSASSAPISPAQLAAVLSAINNLLLND